MLLAKHRNILIDEDKRDRLQWKWSFQKTAALNEIKVIEKHKYNNIIKLYWSSYFNEKYYFSWNMKMKGDLKNLIQNKNKLTDESEILDIFDQLCLSIKYFHDK
jgi:serine/threonine protein kinase